MGLAPQLLDTIGKVVAPSFTEPVTRTFVFGALDGNPGFIAVYVGKQGQAVLRDLQPITSYTAPQYPRRDPYVVLTQSGEEWSIYKGGCGCGSPVRRMMTRQALDDYEQYQAQAHIASTQSATTPG